MIIDLIKENKDKYLSFEIGDILIFYNGEEYDYYQVVYDPVYDPFGEYYSLLCLSTARLYDKTDNLSDLIKRANKVNENNGFKLIEVLKPSEVVLRRVANE